MQLHPNAKLTPANRRLLVGRIREQGWTLSRTARAAGVIDAEGFDAAIAQARTPDFAVLSSVGVAAWGRKP